MASDASQNETQEISCATHPTETCKDHDLALCSLCQIYKHKSCTVDAIIDVFKNVDVSEQIKEASAQITSLKREVVYNMCKNDIEVLKDKIVMEKQEDEENIESIRHGLNQVLDRYKEQLDSQITSETKGGVIPSRF